MVISAHTHSSVRETLFSFYISLETSSNISKVTNDTGRSRNQGLTLRPCAKPTPASRSSPTMSYSLPGEVLMLMCGVPSFRQQTCQHRPFRDTMSSRHNNLVYSLQTSGDIVLSSGSDFSILRTHPVFPTQSPTQTLFEDQQESLPLAVRVHYDERARRLRSGCCDQNSIRLYCSKPRHDSNSKSNGLNANKGSASQQLCDL